ncbi:MAG TPA: alpha/beta hydrolase [Anaerolineales bacterium]|nr:alpha/beta hydrolase [Anaerolineales bacterium]
MLPSIQTHISGVQVSYQESGFGDQHILMVHGWMSSRHMWDDLMDVLAPHFHCWAIDLPGYGDSDKTAHDLHDIQAWSQLLLEFCRLHKIENACIVGHSMGGMISLQTVLHDPERFRKVVVINPVVTGKRARKDLQLLEKLPMRNLQLRVSEWAWPQMMRMRHLIPFYGSAPTATYQRRKEEWAKSSGATIVKSLWTIAQHDLEDMLHQIQQPTLVILGKYDGVVPNRDGQLVAKHVPHAQLFTLDCGHLPTDELPNQTHTLLYTFLAE